MSEYKVRCRLIENGVEGVPMYVSTTGVRLVEEPETTLVKTGFKLRATSSTVQVAGVPSTDTVEAVSYTHLDVYKRQT